MFYIFYTMIVRNSDVSAIPIFNKIVFVNFNPAVVGICPWSDPSCRNQVLVDFVLDGFSRVKWADTGIPSQP